MKVRYTAPASFVLATLVAVASLGGILIPSVYAHETVGWAGQAIGQDWVDLLLAVPWLTVTGIGASRGSRRAGLLLAGGILYTAYEFLIYAFAVHFNALFLIYCATLGLSLFSFMHLTGGLIREPLAFPRQGALPVRTAAGVLLGIGILFGVLWLADVVPALVRGTVPRSIADAGVPTNPVYVIDLSFILPAHVLAAIWLLRRQPLGVIFVPILLGFGVLMSLAIGGMMIVMHLRGVEASLAVAAAMGGVALVSATTLLAFLRKLR